MNIRVEARAAINPWPIFAGTWLVHGAVLVFMFSEYAADSPLSLRERLQAYAAIVCLLTLEIVLLTALSAIFELLTSGLRDKRWVDSLKSLSVASTVGLLVVSSLKFRQTSVHLKSTDLWFAYSNFLQLVQEGQSLEVAALLLFPLSVITLGALVFAGLRATRKTTTRVNPWLLLMVTLVSCVGLAGAYRFSPGVGLFWSDFTPEGFWVTRRIKPLGLLGNASIDSSGTPSRMGALIGDYRPPRRRDLPNVVLIMLESLPWKRTSFAGDRAPSTPNLDRLAEESVVFSRPYAVSPHSDYAQMAILSSLHPRKFDHHDIYSPIEYPRTLLWDVLQSAGYSTEMFSCQNERWGNMLNFLNTPGLELLRHAPNYPEGTHKGRGASSKVHDETAVSEWIKWRERSAQHPYFSYLNFQSNHFPYEIPLTARRSHVPFELSSPVTFFGYARSELEVMKNRYYNALEYADGQVGRILATIKERGEWEQTVVIVVSDHGEAFYEHELPTHGHALFEEQVRSLLMMRLPGRTPQFVDEPVSHLDIVPALLSYLDLPQHGNFQGSSEILEPGYSAEGRSFYFSIQGITQEDAVLRDQWKYIVSWDRRSRALYDLSADPNEVRNLYPEQAEKAAEMDRVLQQFLADQLSYYSEKGWNQGRYIAALQ
jgi:lipoteichoic acid synthase